MSTQLLELPLTYRLYEVLLNELVASLFFAKQQTLDLWRTNIIDVL